MLHTHEVASLLHRSDDQVRRYHKNGLLNGIKNGRDLLFDNDEVAKFAASRGIKLASTQAEGEVPEGANFTMLPSTESADVMELETHTVLRGTPKQLAEYQKQVA